MGLRPGGAAAIRSAAPEAKMAMQLTSPAIRPNQSIPPRFTCSGADVSPPLRWAGAPAETQSFALLVRDRDAHDFTHWVIWNLSARLHGLPEGLENGPAAAGGVQGMNSWQTLGYGGPCPPHGATHHYVFTLYALGHRLSLPAGATSDQVLAAMRGSILAKGQIVATFGR
jgi:Raf kinase inhibitor-like YbhB/YbcL family protein